MVRQGLNRTDFMGYKWGYSRWTVWGFMGLYWVMHKVSEYGNRAGQQVMNEF